MPRRPLQSLRMAALILAGLSTLGCAHAGRAYWVAGYPPPPPRVIVVPPAPVYAPAPYYYESPHAYRPHYHHHHHHRGYDSHSHRGHGDGYRARPPQIREVRPGDWQHHR